MTGDINLDLLAEEICVRFLLFKKNCIMNMEVILVFLLLHGLLLRAMKEKQV